MSYNNQPYYGPMSQEYYNQQRQNFQGQSPRWNKGQKKKKSGAKVHSPYGSSNGLFIHGWKVSDGVKWNIKIFRSKKQQEIAPTESKTGKEWVSVTMVLSAPMKDDVVAYGMMNLGNHKCYFKSWNWIVNPHANNGGYIGKHISKNRN